MPFLIKYHIQRGKEGGIEKGLQHFMNGQRCYKYFPVMKHWSTQNFG